MLYVLNRVRVLKPQRHISTQILPCVLPGNYG